MQNWRLLEDELVDGLRQMGYSLDTTAKFDKIAKVDQWLNVTALARTLSDRVSVNVKAVRVME